jgi:hypothetical protein
LPGRFDIKETFMTTSPLRRALIVTLAAAALLPARGAFAEARRMALVVATK